MTNYELLNTIIEDADHIKETEYNIRYLTLATAAGIFDKGIYDILRDIDSAGFGYAFERMKANTELTREIKTQLFIITLRSAKMPILFKADRDTKYFLMQAGAEHISDFITENIATLSEDCMSFKGIESTEACRYFLEALGRWFLNKDITDAEISQLYEYNIFNSMTALYQSKSVDTIDATKFLVKLSSASDTEFNGIFFGKVFQRMLGDSAFVYDARITKDYALHISYLLKDTTYNSIIRDVSEPAHGMDGSKNCYCIEKKFDSIDGLVAFITALDTENVVKNKTAITSYSITDILGAKFPKSKFSRSSITHKKETFTKPEYSVNINRDLVKRSFNAVLFKAIDDMIC